MGRISQMEKSYAVHLNGSTTTASDAVNEIDPDQGDSSVDDIGWPDTGKSQTLDNLSAEEMGEAFLKLNAG